MFLLGAWFVRSGVMDDTARAPRPLPEARPLRLAVGDRPRRAHRLHRPLAHAGRPARRLGHRARAGHARQPAGVPRLCRPGGDDAAQPHAGVADPRARAARPHGPHQLSAPVARLHGRSSSASRSAAGGCRAPSRCCSWRRCSSPRSRSATGGWRTFATARWNGYGAASRTGRCRRCASPPPSSARSGQRARRRDRVDAIVISRS